MFRIKICGLTNLEDALAAFDAGADGIGFNFYRQSKRHVGAKMARIISDELYKAAGVPGRSLLYPIGVFVNHSATEVKQLHNYARLVAVQLHGDEPPEFLSSICGIPVIRARRLDERGTAALADDLQACRSAIDVCDSDVRGSCSLLVDAAAPGQYGGTGETISWPVLESYQYWLGTTELILAGGLTPDNVAEAIRIVRPNAVDVASGVESAPGKKDPAKMRDFVAAARAAFAEFT